MIISNMDLPIETFHKMVGEILMYCQCVEENIRRIYAQRMPGDSRLNYLSIEEERLTMGQMVTKLKELDAELPHPLFEKEEQYNDLGTFKGKAGVSTSGACRPEEDTPPG